MRRLFVGVDGGQSHTEAVVADENGQVLGRGQGGPSNHADQPGGRERLRRAIRDSVGSALASAVLPELPTARFASAHCAMTGGPEDKAAEIKSLLHADCMTVGHDAPAALAGATACGPGIVVIAGTGSVAYGETSDGRAAMAGGWGYVLGDEGSGYWIAVEALRRAARGEDALAPATRLGAIAAARFNCATLRELGAQIQAGAIGRDQLARFAPEVEASATAGDRVASEIVDAAGSWLASFVLAVAGRLSLRDEIAQVAEAGGLWRLARLRAAFADALVGAWPAAQLVAPRYDPVIGALLLAYRQAGLDLSPIVAALDAARSGVNQTP